MPDYDFLYAVENGVATITFNRPEVLNALTLEIYAHLRDLFEDLRSAGDVKVVILTGAGAPSVPAAMCTRSSGSGWSATCTGTSSSAACPATWCATCASWPNRSSP